MSFPAAPLQPQTAMQKTFHRLDDSSVITIG
jgi:hypothetical protein